MGSSAPKVRDNDKLTLIFKEFSKMDKPQTMATEFSNMEKPQTMATEFSNLEKPQTMATGYSNLDKPQTMASADARGPFVGEIVYEALIPEYLREKQLQYIGPNIISIERWVTENTTFPTMENVVPGKKSYQSHTFENRQRKVPGAAHANKNTSRPIEREPSVGERVYGDLLPEGLRDKHLQNTGSDVKVVAELNTSEDENPKQLLGILPPSLPAGRSLERNYTVCQSTECQLVALSFKSLLDVSASPCHDFERFICGNLKNNKEAKKANVQTSSVNTVQALVLRRKKALLEYPEVEKPKNATETVRAFYQGCVLADQMKSHIVLPSIKKALREVGGMPFLEDTGYDASVDWTVHVAKVYRKLSVDVIFGFGIGTDIDSKHYRLLDIAEPDSFGISRDALVENDTESRKSVWEYWQLMNRTLCILREGKCGPAQYQQIRDILHFEMLLAALTSPVKKRTYSSRVFRKKPFSYVIRNFPEINWKSFMVGLFSNTSITFYEESAVGFLDENFFKTLPKILSATKKETIGNYIGWRAFRKLPVFTMEPFKEDYLKFFSSVTEQTKLPDPKNVCAAFASRLFPQSLGRLYVERYFSSTDKAEVTHMVHHIKSAMGELIDKNYWMDGTTKFEARKKLREMDEFIGFPAWIFEDTALDEREHMYRHGVFNKHNYIDSVMKLYEERISRLLWRIFVEIRQAEWPLSPADANAFYATSKNLLAVPAGILQPSFYMPQTIRALNYGAIGTVIGHEIMHAFDLRGGDFDLNGNERPWWTQASKEAYNKKSQCFIDQYSSVVDKQTNMHLNGSRTLGENLNDHAGLMQAFNALTTEYTADVRLPGLEEYSREQLFFIAYGRIWCGKYPDEELRYQIEHGEHTPVTHRTYMPLRNIPGFAHSFNCPVGSLMNPEKQCDMWLQK